MDDWRVRRREGKKRGTQRVPSKNVTVLRNMFTKCVLLDIQLKKKKHEIRNSRGIRNNNTNREEKKKKMEKYTQQSLQKRN